MASFVPECLSCNKPTVDSWGFCQSCGSFDPSVLGCMRQTMRVATSDPVPSPKCQKAYLVKGKCNLCTESQAQTQKQTQEQTLAQALAQVETVDGEICTICKQYPYKGGKCGHCGHDQGPTPCKICKQGNVGDCYCTLALF